MDLINKPCRPQALRIFTQLRVGRLQSLKLLVALSQFSESTLWRYARGRPSRGDKAVKQQYLTPCEEKCPR
jgi:hypothetical protein